MVSTGQFSAGEMQPLVDFGLLSKTPRICTSELARRRISSPMNNQRTRLGVSSGHRIRAFMRARDNHDDTIITFRITRERERERTSSDKIVR